MTGLEKWRETRVKLAVFFFFLLAAFFHLFPLGLYPAANDFLQVEFHEPQNVGQVSLRLENFSQDYAADLDVEVTEDGLNWKILAGRYSAGEFAWTLTRQPGRPVQNLYLRGRAIKALRIVNMRDAPARPWSVAELEVYGLWSNK